MQHFVRMRLRRRASQVIQISGYARDAPYSKQVPFDVGKAITELSLAHLPLVLSLCGTDDKSSWPRLV